MAKELNYQVVRDCLIRLGEPAISSLFHQVAWSNEESDHLVWASYSCMVMIAGGQGFEEELQMISCGENLAFAPSSLDCSSFVFGSSLV